MEEGELEGFLQWATALGIADSPASHGPSSFCLRHSLCVAHFPEAGGRGLAATRVLRKGELILRVPKEVLMTSDCLISKDHRLSAAFGKYPLLSSTQILSIALLNEVNKGRSSWWCPYLKQLPKSYDLLASFGQFEIEALQIDDAIWTAEKAVQKSKMEWIEATPVLCELGLKRQFTTFNAWLWASATISSRTMHVSWDTAGCLCPVGDFFNYVPPEDPHHLNDSRARDASSFQHKTSSCEGDGSGKSTEKLVDAGYDEALASYCFYAKRNYERGDQIKTRLVTTHLVRVQLEQKFLEVLLSYGTYTNLELLEHYGFLLPSNPNDKAFISLEPEMYALCPWPKDSLYISCDGKPSFALLSTVRLWATPASKRRSVKRIAYSGQRISDENENAVMEWIAKKCHVILTSCTTSVDEDASLLSIIDKIQDYSGETELSSHMPYNEIHAFLRSNHIKSEELSTKLQISAKTRRYIYRWKLAVQWRFRYKKLLSDSISHCTGMLPDA